jgi:hypothetical protein
MVLDMPMIYLFLIFNVVFICKINIQYVSFAGIAVHLPPPPRRRAIRGGKCICGRLFCSCGQGCGSGFSDFVDPDPNWETGSRGKKIKKFQ